MNFLSEFFASHGINPFLAGFVIGAVSCAIVRVGISTASFTDKNFMTKAAEVSAVERRLNSDISAAILAELRCGNKIQAIRILRESSDIGLAQAKSVVEALGRSQGVL